MRALETLQPRGSSSSATSPATPSFSTTTYRGSVGDHLLDLDVFVPVREQKMCAVLTHPLVFLERQ